MCFLPFEVCIEPVKQYTELLFKGVKLPYEVAVRVKDGKPEWIVWYRVVFVWLGNQLFLVKLFVVNEQ